MKLRSILDFQQQNVPIGWSKRCFRSSLSSCRPLYKHRVHLSHHIAWQMMLFPSQYTYSLHMDVEFVMVRPNHPKIIEMNEHEFIE